MHPEHRASAMRPLAIARRARNCGWRRCAPSLLALLAALCAPPALAQDRSNLRGDVDGDTAVTAIDALAVLSHVVGKPLPPGSRPVPNGDADGSGQVTAGDALVLLSAAVGKDVSRFGVGLPMRVTVEVEPGLLTLRVGGSGVLAATVRGHADTRVFWSIETRPGDSPSPTPVATIDSAGVVRAQWPGGVWAVARARGDTTARASANIWVEPALASLRIASVDGQAPAPGRTIPLDGAFGLGVMVRVPPSSPRAVQALVVHARAADGTEHRLYTPIAPVPPGDSVVRVLPLSALASGPHQLFVEAWSSGVFSDTVWVQSNRPRPTFRLVSINGQLVAPGHTVAVADSFFGITVDVAVPAGADTLYSTALWALRDGGPATEVGRTSFDRVNPGTTRRVVFPGGLAPAGAYRVFAGAQVYAEGWGQAMMAGDTSRVQVTQSDVTPPSLSITAPAPGAVIGGAENLALVRFTVHDNRSLYRWEVASPLGSTGLAAAWGQPQGEKSAFVRLQTGRNVIHVAAVDLALNTTRDSVVVTYDPTVSGPAPTTVRILSVNGAPVQAGATVLAADSMTVTVEVEAGADAVGTLTLQRWISNGANSRIGIPVAQASALNVLPGTRRTVTLRAWYVPAGTADLVAVAGAADGSRSWSSAQVPVSVTQSDATPPSLRIVSPAAGAATSVPYVDVTFEASDDGWLYEYETYLNGTNTWVGLIPSATRGAPPTTRTQRVPQAGEAGRMEPGDNTVRVDVRDRAGNVTTRSIIIRYVP